MFRRAFASAIPRPRVIANRRSLAFVAGSAVLGSTYLAWNSRRHPLALDSADTDSRVVTREQTPSDALDAPRTPEKASTASANDNEAQDGAEAEDTADQGAYDPVTGEINWDCPCLGGMAHGPCGMQFREAFSCFIYSQDEPKGINCVEKFKTMQDCFREHPEVYGEDMDDDDENVDLAGSEASSTNPQQTDSIPTDTPLSEQPTTQSSSELIE